MNISGLLTSAGINTGLDSEGMETSEEELYAAGGVDAVVFLRMVVFSLRVFTVAAVICLFLVLPLNYFGTDMEHKLISNEPLSVFTIGNVKEGSKWLWAHCLALYIITCCACILLYYEYKNITKIRLAHIAASVSHPSYFTVIVRGIPWVQDESYSDTVAKFFTDFYASSYLSHQMVYQTGAVQKLMATYFMTYVLTSGWASLSCEIIQPFPLLCNLFYRYILRNMDDSSYGAYTFPYHTEVPRVLLFGVLGFTCSTIAPLILPFLLVYFFLAYLVYRNQIIIEMDRKDEHCAEEMHQKLQSSYCQFRSRNLNLHDTSECSNKPQSVLSSAEMGDVARVEDLENSTSALPSLFK
ncbi:UNVERIFIED_CONTAM: CSC1-like protein RXW8 [Sesamum calycinum]|uniref:CSC1-like protein RXW8 n=1 Tax=Sesamum calycinum TaxID=2727403 RepID=A0AAW2P7U5_9LAMI